MRPSQLQLEPSCSAVAQDPQHWLQAWQLASASISTEARIINRRAHTAKYQGELGQCAQSLAVAKGCFQTELQMESRPQRQKQREREEKPFQIIEQLVG